MNFNVIHSVVALLLLAPLGGAIINSFRWESKNVRQAFFTATVACLVSFICAIFLFFLVQKQTTSFVSFFEWVSVLPLKVSISFLIDPLSVFMLLLITGVGFLIHVFSAYYMSHDKRPAKYFAYLNLFIFCMINLVLADNLLLMFLGWEGVGLCSYLLIGFWFEKKEKALAGMKAFIVNRIGDMGFVVGLLLLFQQFSSLEFSVLSAQVGEEGGFNLNTVSWACLFLFLGVAGKSAQIPLYMWLPSAMAGPTPVSALIHAATMVTAGVYLMARLSFLFTLSPVVMHLIAWVGVLTALLAALIATAQSDIKKVLAYSTVSQLGYMVLACGVGAFSAGLFHLLTHGFFKALLFLCAGAIIHALHGEQNINRMGGLKKHLPWTHLCFMAGFLALIGVPPLAGFFSKDEILWSVFASGHGGLWIIAFLTAGLTAFYMTRLFILVFYGKSFKLGIKPQEGGFLCKFPLGALAVLSLLGGFLGVPHVISAWLPGHPPHLIDNFLKSVVGHVDFKGSYATELVLMLSSVCLAIVVFSTTCWLYLKKKTELLKIKQKNKAVFGLLEEAFKVDAFCYKKIVQPTLSVSQALWHDIEEGFIQAGILWIQKWLLSLKNIFKGLQNGNMQSYILFMVLGVMISLLAILIR